jgi:hypothetical protein
VPCAGVQPTLLERHDHQIGRLEVVLPPAGWGDHQALAVEPNRQVSLSRNDQAGRPKAGSRNDQRTACRGFLHGRIVADRAAPTRALRSIGQAAARGGISSELETDPAAFAARAVIQLRFIREEDPLAPWALKRDHHWMLLCLLCDCHVGHDEHPPCHVVCHTFGRDPSGPSTLWHHGRR